MATPNTPEKTPDLQKLQEAVLMVQLERERLQLADLQRQKASLQAQEDLDRASREIGASAVKRQMAQTKDTQDHCPHIKPNAQPAIAGQWDHHGTYHWICAYCSKEWKDNDLPIHLRIDMSKVGGPGR